MRVKMKNHIKVVSVIIAGILLLSGCGKQTSIESKSELEVIKIGVIEPLSGANEEGGKLELEGIKLANDMYPMILGRKVQLVIADNKSDKETSAQLAQRLIDDYGVSAIIGSWGSGLSIAAGKAIKKGKIPAIAPSATNPEVTKDNDYYFRACFIDPFQGEVLAKMAYKRLEAKTAVVIYEKSNEYSQGLATFFEEEFTKLTENKSSIIKKIGYEPGTTDFNSILESIEILNPDVIFAPGNFTESAMLIKQAKRMGIRADFLGGDTWENPEFLNVGGEAVEGVLVTTSFSAEKPANLVARKFVSKYTKQYNREPLSLSALGFDSYRIIIEAIERSGTAEDGEKLRAEIAATKNFEGATGKITLDENGDAIKDVVVLKVKNGKFVYQTTVRYK